MITTGAEVTTVATTLEVVTPGTVTLGVVTPGEVDTAEILVRHRGRCALFRAKERAFSERDLV